MGPDSEQKDTPRPMNGGAAEAHLPSAVAEKAVGRSELMPHTGHEGPRYVLNLPPPEEFVKLVLPTVRFLDTYNKRGPEQLRADYEGYLLHAMRPYAGLRTPEHLVRPISSILEVVSRFYGERYGPLLGDPPLTIFGPFDLRAVANEDKIASDTMAIASPSLRLWGTAHLKQRHLGSLEGQMTVVHEFAHLLSPVLVEQPFQHFNRFTPVRHGWCFGAPRELAAASGCRYYQAVEEGTAEAEALAFARSLGRRQRIGYAPLAIEFDLRDRTERELAGLVRDLIDGPDSIVRDVRVPRGNRILNGLANAVEYGLESIFGRRGFVDSVSFAGLATCTDQTAPNTRGTLVYALDKLIEERCGPEGVLRGREEVCRARFLPDHGEAEALLARTIGPESAEFLKYANRLGLVFLYAECGKLPPGRRENVRERLLQNARSHDGRRNDFA